jgi:predicted O-methyltransferase YrrM
MTLTLPTPPKNLQDAVEQCYKSNPYTSGTSLSLQEVLVIASAIAEFKPERTLEIGLAHAGSTTAILTAKKHFALDGIHYAVDPYQKTHSASRGLEVLEKLGFNESFQWIEDWSENYLPQAIEAGELFDFILVDGGHGLGQAMVDAYFADRLLRIGGLMAIDDIYMETTCQSIKYLVNECKYEILNCQPSLYNVLRFPKISRRLGASYAKDLLSKSVDGLVLLRKTQDYHGGY